VGSGQWAVSSWQLAVGSEQLAVGSIRYSVYFLKNKVGAQHFEPDLIF